MRRGDHNSEACAQVVGIKVSNNLENLPLLFNVYSYQLARCSTE